MSHWFERIATRILDEAQAAGKLSNLPGEGRPLDRARLRETAEQTMHRLLAEEGFVPPEVEMQKEIAAKRGILEQIEDPEERAKLQRQIALMELKRAMAMENRARDARR
ncbi:DUF1992 domain-containing protein (plasmid) [Paracoccus sp. TK19116]|uniref:DUF1992 domain-containing protein n=1 Tax=Paracoccus albicereus TaxID=2922394 RepID=A0ABT1ML11_9RHOB|nr:DnaJ family domain-containing protein [Paracoccus albicereus]MCQ0968982.1 DUF1992 domain-containing protein [Paracoccus albicereus]